MLQKLLFLARGSSLNFLYLINPSMQEIFGCSLGMNINLPIIPRAISLLLLLSPPSPPPPPQFLYNFSNNRSLTKYEYYYLLILGVPMTGHTLELCYNIRPSWVLINRGAGLYRSILTEVLSTDRTQWADQARQEKMRGPFIVSWVRLKKRFIKWRNKKTSICRKRLINVAGSHSL